MNKKKKVARNGLVFISLLILLFVFLILNGGCFSTPVFKMVPRQQLPKESFKSEEHTRKAVQLFNDYLKETKANPSMRKLASALSAKMGIPTAIINNTVESIDDLAEKLLKDKKEMRKKKKEWENKFDQALIFMPRPKTVMEKVTSGFWWIVWIFIGCCLLIPGFWLGFRKKAKKLYDEHVKTFEEDYDLKTRFQEGTVKAVDKIKKEAGEYWEKIEGYFKENHDQDIQDKIKNRH